MQKISIKRSALSTGIGLLFMLSFCFTVSSCSDSGQKVLAQSQFKKDAEGWEIVGDVKGSTGAEPNYSSDGGEANGYIHAKDDVTGGVWYFSAPDKYKGNKSNFYGATLTYYLYQHSDMDDQFNSEDIIIKNGDNRIYYTITNYPDTTWSKYTVEINDSSGWQTGASDSNHKRATKQDMKEVLSNITAFRIRGEYQSGPDEDGLDEVKIVK